jgi:ankyrin repeat protein
MEKNARIARLFNGHMVYLAVKSNNLDLVEYFVDEKGEEIDKEIYSHAIETGYGAAFENGNLPIIKYFVKKGVKISSESSHDDPVYFAARSGKLNIVKYFVEKGAEINNEAIYVAFENGHQNIVNYLKSAMNRS